MSYTEIVCVIDKSGSMGSVTRDSINGFNEFLKQQQELPGEAKFTLILFDTNYNIICNGINIKDAEPLTNKTYVPSGFTALLDAVGKAIDSVGERLSNSLEKPSKVIVAILTDGEENSSKEYSLATIKSKVEHQQNNYSWEFIYLGANQDAFAEASKLGIKAYNTFNYDIDNTMGTYALTMSRAVKSYRN